jgi:hypothetical protein
MQLTSCTANMFQDHVGHVYAQRNKCSRRVKQCHAITRKVKALYRLLVKLPRLPWNLYWLHPRSRINTCNEIWHKFDEPVMG